MEFVAEAVKTPGTRDETKRETDPGGTDGGVAGTRLTDADATAELDATLAAFTATVWAVAIDAGAVYRPEVEIVPTAGEMLQVTAVLVVPVTEAENC